MNRISLVSFDATNTLIKFKLPSGVAYQQVCKQYGVNLDADHLQNSFKAQYKVTSGRFPNFGHDTIGCRKWWFTVVSETLSNSGFKAKNNSGNERLLEKIFQHLYDAFSTDEFWTLDQNALNVLETLKKNRQKLAVVSNTDERLDSILRSLRIRQYFDVVVNSYQAGVSKPQRGIFDLALSLAYSGNRRGLVPQQAVHIGDSLELDFQGARGSGWHALLFDKEHMKHANVEEKFVLKSLLEIPLKLPML